MYVEIARNNVNYPRSHGKLPWEMCKASSFRFGFDAEKIEGDRPQGTKYVCRCLYHVYMYALNMQGSE